MTLRERTKTYLSVTCAMCGHQDIVGWSGGKGGLRPPVLWLCLDHEVHVR